MLYGRAIREGGNQAMTGRRREVGSYQPDDYVLGSDDPELRRLRTISILYRDTTRRWLEQAGIGPGMSVVDVGCGPGDVALLAAELVGADGSVLGVDGAPEALDLARSRAEEARLPNVRYEQADVTSWLPSAEGGAVDAIVGRLILMHLPDPAKALSRLARAVRPGGMIAFQDVVLATRRAEPALPLVGAFNGWLLETLRRAGRPVDMGLRLAAVFREAGLPEPGLCAGQPVERGAGALGYSIMAGDVVSLLGRMQALGVATTAEVRPETFEERLRAEAADADAVLLNPLMVGAWARVR
jgi:SAM-dependent methyltransferase